MTTLAFNDRTLKTTPALSTDPQTLDFPIFSDSDIDVYVNGTLTTDWTIASTYADGVADSAIITIITPVETSPTVEIVGARDPRRDQFLVAAGAQLVAAMNSDLARRTVESQELFRDMVTAIKVPVGEDLNNVLPKADTRASKYMFFASDGSVGVTGTAPAVQYQGAFTTASEPTLRLGGTALVTGDLYFNTTDDVFKVYDGANWITAVTATTAAVDITVADSGTFFAGSDVEAVLADIGGNYAKLFAPVFTGNPTATTQSSDDSSTRLATTAFVQGEIGVLDIIIIKAADETVNNSTTLQDDNHLFFAMAANTTYWFEIYLLYSEADTTPNFNTKLSVPTGCVAFWDSNWATTATIATEVTEIDSFPAAGTHATRRFIIARNGSTAGNMQLQWAQETAHASDTKVLKHSHMIVRKLGAT